MENPGCFNSVLEELQRANNLPKFSLGNLAPPKNIVLPDVSAAANQLGSEMKLIEQNATNPSNPNEGIAQSSSPSPPTEPPKNTSQGKNSVDSATNIRISNWNKNIKPTFTITKKKHDNTKITSDNIIKLIKDGEIDISSQPKFKKEDIVQMLTDDTLLRVQAANSTPLPPRSTRGSNHAR